MGKRKTTEWFIEEAKKVHGNKYDYSKVVYKNNRTKVCIICPIHGEFWQVPRSHLLGMGCRKCAAERQANRQTKTTAWFIEQAKKIHGNKYDYSKVNYVNTHEKVIIICPKHGEFLMSPNNHLSGQDCPKCKCEKLRNLKVMSKEDFFNRCKEKYKNKFTYKEDTFTDLNSEIEYFCPKHGWMKETANFHLHTKHGCRKCANEKIREFKKDAEMLRKEIFEMYGDLYTFKNEDYKGMHNKMKFTCKLHGDFIESPTNLKRHCVCKKCSKIYSLENEISNILKDNNIIFEHQKRNKWLGKLSLDFYLPQYNIAIECQGRQHYEIVNDFGGESTFKDIQQRDQRKKQLCEENGVKLLYYTTYKNVKEDEITFKNKEKILDFIYKHEKVS